MCTAEDGCGSGWCCWVYELRAAWTYVQTGVRELGLPGWNWMIISYCDFSLFTLMIIEWFRIMSGLFRRRRWHPTPVLVPGKSHGRRSLVGCSPRSYKELDTTEHTHGEGNGTPLRYSCLKIPWTEEPGGLQSMASLRVGYDWATSLSLFTFTHWRRKWQPTPAFLPGESQGRGSLVGCRLWGRTE